MILQWDWGCRRRGTCSVCLDACNTNTAVMRRPSALREDNDLVHTATSVKAAISQAIDAAYSPDQKAYPGALSVA